MDLVDLVDQTGLVPLASKDPAERASQSQEAEVDTSAAAQAAGSGTLRPSWRRRAGSPSRSNPSPRRPHFVWSRFEVQCRRFTSRRSLASLRVLSGAEPVALAPVGPVPGAPQSPECNLDQAELSDHVGDRAVLVDHQGGHGLGGTCLGT